MDFAQFQEQFHLTLNPQQAEAVQSTEGSILLLAVPGSGKTTVLVTRLAYMILCRGIRPQQILTMTYTVAAARDMRARFADLFGTELANRIEFRTINGVSAKIIQFYENHLGRKAFDLISDEGTLQALIRELYHRQKSDFLTDAEIKSFRTAITYIKNQMLDDAEIDELGKRLDGIPALYRAYQQHLQQTKRMDYDDQMVYALQILKRYPEILQHVQAQFSYLCVDEAQDTSKIQHEIIALLAGKSGNLFMVGDEDQSIYGFRAAYPEALVHFEQAHPGAKVLLMEQNYRSTREIVAKADAFIQKNAARHPKHMHAVRGHGAAVKRIDMKNRWNQYSYLLKVAADCSVQTAVLYRDNDCALPLIDMLERSGLPYTARRPESSFFSHRVVREIREIITLALEPCSKELFLQHYYKFSAPITKEAAQRAAAQDWRELPFFHILAEDESLPQYTRNECERLAAHFEALPDLPADRAVYRIASLMGYRNYLESRGADDSKLDILEALGRQESTPAGLLRRLDELEQLLKGAPPSASGGLILSTVHSSKGLEYDRVFLMDTADGIMPKLGDDVDADEERRIFYVAMTRAKNELLIFDFGNSSFCNELFSPSPTQLQRHGTATAPLKPKAAADPRLLSAAKEFVPGRSVIHRVCGRGVIRGNDGVTLTIRFEDGQEKKFLFYSVLEKGLVTPDDVP